MKKPKLDRTDLKILQKLQKEGRITNVELAQHAGISAPPCLRRMRTLENTGVIQSYYAKINPVSMGYGVSVFAQVKLNSQNENQIKEFERALQEWRLVREAYLVTGDMDYLLKVVSTNWESYQEFLTNQLTAHPTVVSVKTASVIKMSKDVPGVPIDAP
jgi:DNA-binding Lrp family transcriptional regulator